MNFIACRVCSLSSFPGIVCRIVTGHPPAFNKSCCRSVRLHCSDKDSMIHKKLAISGLGLMLFERDSAHFAASVWVEIDHAERTVLHATEFALFFFSSFSTIFCASSPLSIDGDLFKDLEAGNESEWQVWACL
uniref:Uncharacterized protein n=1 Tax=Asterionellopsis glacialis TaxID=33640 RepID=A0A7S0L0Y0_9STRA